MPFPGWRSRYGGYPPLTGEFEINCSQLCGLGHYRMRAALHSQTQAEFDAWLVEQASFQ